MGCCVSTPTDPPPPSCSFSASPKKQNLTTESRAPPPSAEEESVKEVLSETPKSKPKPSIVADVKLKPENVEMGMETEFAEGKKDGVDVLESKKQQYSHYSTIYTTNNEESMSEVSEICSVSLSESLSTTTTVTDKREFNEEVNKNPAKIAPRNREYYGVRRDHRIVGQSPTRRSDQSPVKRNNSGSVRLVQSRKEAVNRSTGRYGSSPDPKRRDPGESSGRRSRSPAMTRSGTMGRSPSANRTNRSPGRVRTTTPIENGGGDGDGVGGKLMDRRNPEGSCKWPSNNSSSKINSNSNCSTNESLENPLVSLECFIFL